jgi:hypothetical protein
MQDYSRVWSRIRPVANIGSIPRKQVKFQAKAPNPGEFGVLDLRLARTVNGVDRWPLDRIEAVTEGP